MTRKSTGRFQGQGPPGTTLSQSLAGPRLQDSYVSQTRATGSLFPSNKSGCHARAKGVWKLEFIELLSGFSKRLEPAMPILQK